MGVGQARCVALEGLEGLLVTVECDLGRGLPGISVVGLGDASVVQAKDRIRSAMHNTKVPWPQSRVVMSLSPASVPKSGAGFDLAMVCAMVSAQLGSVRIQRRLSTTVLVGELGLDGSVRRVDGVVPIVQAAGANSIPEVVVPAANATEAARAEQGTPGVRVYAVESLADVLTWLHTGQALAPASQRAEGGGDGYAHPTPPDMAEVVSQPEARRAVEVAAAGGHNLMLMGPPGSGKSMLARRLPGILPPMSGAEQLEVAAVHSIAGHKGNLAGVWSGQRPFIAPHHGVTQAALIGGGSGRILPGAISLAHRGVLFIDEMPEAKAEVLDALRVPMETRWVEIVRARRSVRFPAQFQLVLAANPCPCGAEQAADCTCPGSVRQRYQAKLSGPLRDRIDVYACTRSTRAAVIRGSGEETTAVIAARVAEARERSHRRWAELAPGAHSTNATVAGTVLRKLGAPEEEGLLALQELLREAAVTQRGVDRALRVAWTLADLEGTARPGLGHILDAVELYSSRVLEAVA
ncbi:YifB family Mg chelatase-like AAA ATPase [Corynebacterium heidelbergense]|uniref:Magnesium chelatase n=1 Tax=Corynebacterium heidelbergense TaxID=2055947 RepID=A0A364VCU4_9CORY|nr:YifB family Mg chelatase-like AAA ATPase [Corynebacterium heidelbergense]RAV34475.1 magnesium chelatase [Corynebacterium heidelbergense]WCZ36764.1 Competence protein ComM [Corynebacterium heidelbergense]